MAAPAAEAQQRLRGPSVAPASVPYRTAARRPHTQPFCDPAQPVPPPGAGRRLPEPAHPPAPGAPPPDRARPMGGGSRGAVPPLQPRPRPPGHRSLALRVPGRVGMGPRWWGAGAGARPGAHAVTEKRHGLRRLTSALALGTHTTWAAGDLRGLRRQSAGVPSSWCWLW